MHNQAQHLHQFQNQLNYLIGQLMALYIMLQGRHTNAAVLHLSQTAAGSANKLLNMEIKGLREEVITLTNTLIDEKITDDETRSKAYQIRNSALTMPPSKLPEIIDLLGEMINFTGLKSIG